MAIIDEKTKMHTEMEPVDITFSDLTYTVPISRGKGKSKIICMYFSKLRIPSCFSQHPDRNKYDKS